MSYEPMFFTAYSERDSNAHWRRSERRASTVGLPEQGVALRGPDRTRTGHLRCARAALYLMSYEPVDVPGPAVEPRELRCLNAAALPVRPAGRESQRAGSNRLPPGYESGAPPVVLRWHGADGRARTGCLRITRAALYLLSFVGVVRALGAIRTRTVQILGLVPLPLGHEGMSWEPRIRT
jgi:hypothetical protein